MRAWICMLSFGLIAGCKGPAAEPTDAAGSFDAASADAAMPDGAVPDGAVPDAASPDATAPDAAIFDARPPDATSADASTTVGTITAVEITGGFHQIRQGGYDEIIVTGTDLDHVTAVKVGDLDAPIVSATPTALHATLAIPPGHAVGAQDVTVTFAAGSASLAGALTITYVVVSPTGTAGARATYESPILLCDSLLADDTRGDTVELLAGTHTCAKVFLYEAHVLGHGSATTIVNGTFEIDGTPPQAGARTWTISGVHVQTGGIAFWLQDGEFEMKDVVIDGASAGVAVLSLGQPWEKASLFIDGFTYRGPGIAIDVGDQNVEAHHATIASTDGASSCVVAYEGVLQMFDSSIEGCAIGIDQQGGGIDIMALGDVYLTRCALWDNAIGIRMSQPSLAQLTDTFLRDREGTALPANIGVSIVRGGFRMLRGDITGYKTGIVGDGHGDYTPGVDLSHVTIDVETTGVDVSSLSDPFDSLVRIHDSVIHAGSGGGVIVGDDTSCDLGTAATPGNNQIIVTGGFALDTALTDTLEQQCDAHGTTLNGHSYDGQTIQGPIMLGTDYRIRDDSRIQF
jgi:hypothetical protein